MKKYLKSLVFLVVLFTTKALKAQDWQYLTKNHEGYEVYVRSVNTNSAFSKEVWVKTIGRKITIKKNGKLFVYKNAYTLSLMQFFCYNSEYKIRTYYEYSSEGKLLNSEEYGEYEVESSKVVPETLGETIFNNICE
jgi:hypothetical protein